MTTSTYREQVNAAHPDYRAIHAMRIDKATRALINRYPLEYDDLLHAPRPSLQWARAELRRRHRDEWRLILSQVPGTLRDVKLGWSLCDMKAWEQ